MASIKLKGREIPLIYTVYEMKQIQEEIGDLSSVLYRVTGRDPKDENNTDPYGGVDHLEMCPLKRWRKKKRRNPDLPDGGQLGSDRRA